MKFCQGNITCLVKPSTSVAVCNGIVVVVRNYLMDFMSISMSNSVTAMSASMTSMPKTSMANARASMVTNRSMSSTEATDLGRGGGEEGKDANEDLEVKFCKTQTRFKKICESPSFCELSPNSDQTSLVFPFIPRLHALFCRGPVGTRSMQLKCSK